MRKHVMSPTKFTMTQTTNDHFNIPDVSQHVKRWITNNWLQWSHQLEIYNFANSFDNRFDSSRGTVCVV